jgi:hypothetical protein
MMIVLTQVHKSDDEKVIKKQNWIYMRPLSCEGACYAHYFDSLSFRQMVCGKSRRSL